MKPIYLSFLLLFLLSLTGCSGQGVLPPNPPTSVSVRAGNGTAIVTWSSVETATSYNLYYVRGSRISSKLACSTVTGVTSPYVLSGLSNGWAYSFAVASVGTGGESELSVVVTTTPTNSAISTNPSVAAGYQFSLALKSDGTLYSWGENFYGELGNGTLMNSAVPAQIPNITGIVEIAAGFYHALAVRVDGTVWAWGRNDSSQLGNNSTTNSLTPVVIPGITGVVAVAAGQEHSLALKSDGTVWAWGNNDYGQLGNGTTVASAVPIEIPFLTGVTTIAAGANHSIAIKSDGTAWTWGENNYGQLGIGSTVDSSIPIQITTEANSAAGGFRQTIIVTRDGKAFISGYNTTTGLNQATPTLLPGITNADFVSSGYNFIIFNCYDDNVWGWGENSRFQVGCGTAVSPIYTPTHTTGPSSVGYFTDAIDIASGYQHTLAIRSNGTVWCWGNNTYGQLGNGTMIPANIPAQALGLIL